MPRTSHHDAELDLHELTVEQAMEQFIRLYNRRVSAGEKGDIDVIHGNVHGNRIKRRLHAFLATQSDKLSYAPGENLDGNPGHTIVYPNRPLPDKTDLLGSEILAFCETPKTREKIASKFYRYPHKEIVQAIDILVRDGRLAEIKSGIKKYQARKEL